MKHLVVMPHRFALGDYITRMPWRVAALKADRITVCCPPTWRGMFPSASDFVDVPEVYNERQLRDVITRQVMQEYPSAEMLVFKNGDPELRPKIKVQARKGVDVVIAPRFKVDVETQHRNWKHWEKLCLWLQSQGLRVVSVGKNSMSVPLPCEHVERVDEMMECVQGARLVISTDSAVAHMAVMMGRPLAVIWGNPVGVIPGQTYVQGCHKIMERQKVSSVWHLEDAWNSFDKCALALAPVLHQAVPHTTRAVVLSSTLLMRSPLKKWMDERCASAGVSLAWHDVNDAGTRFIETFRSHHNVIAWNCRMPHKWTTQEGQNVLHVENSLISQKSGMFVDHRGFFSQSNLCRSRTWEGRYAHANPEFFARREFGWQAFSGGDTSGPVLVALQCRNDCNLKQEFPLAEGCGDKVVKTLEILRDHLPHGRPVLVRPHPREREKFISDLQAATGGVWRHDWTLDMEGSFASRLPQCSVLVTVNSTCVSEAALLGIPTATLGTGAFTGSGTTLECANNPGGLAGIFDFQVDLKKCRCYVSAILGRHFMPYDLRTNRPCLEFESWLEACQKSRVTESVKPLE